MFLIGDIVKNIFTRELGVVTGVNHKRQEPYMVRYGNTTGKFAAGPVPQKESWMTLADIRGS